MNRISDTMLKNLNESLNVQNELSYLMLTFRPRKKKPCHVSGGTYFQLSSCSQVPNPPTKHLGGHSPGSKEEESLIH